MGALDIAIAIKAVDSFSRAFGQARSGMKGLRGAANTLRTSFRELAGVAVLAGARMAMAFGQESVEAFQQFDKTMHEAGSIVGATEDQIDSFAMSVRHMTKTLPQTADELGAGLYQIFSAGVTESAAAMDTLGLAARAAVAGLTSTERAATAGIATMNAFGMDVEDLTHIFDVHFATVKFGILRYEDLASQVGRMSAAAKGAGQSMERTFAALATLTKAGYDAAQAGTRVTRAFQALVRPEVIKNLYSLGVAILDSGGNVGIAEKKWSDAKVTLEGMVTSLDKNGEVLTRLKRDYERAGESVEYFMDTQQTTSIAVIQATREYRRQQQSLTYLEAQARVVKDSMEALNDSMSKNSIEQRKNRLEVMKIEQKAASTGRALTAEEEKRIEALRSENKKLSISQEEMGIQAAESRMKQEEMNRAIRAQKVEVEGAQTAMDSAVQGEYARLQSIQESIGREIEQTSSIIKSQTEDFKLQAAEVKEVEAQFLALATAQGTFRDMGDILDDIKLKTDDMTAAEKALALAKIFTEVRAREGIVTLLDLKDTYDSTTAFMVDASGTMTQAFDTQMESGDAANKLYQNALEDTKIVIGSELQPVMEQWYEFMAETLLPILEKHLIPIIESIIPIIKGVVDVIKPLITFLSDHTEVLWALVAAYVAFKFAMGISSIIKGVQGAIAALSAAKAFLTGVTWTETIAQWAANAAMYACPIVWIVGLILLLIGVIYYLYKNWDKVTEAVGNFADGAKEKLGALWNWMKDGSRKIVDGVKKNWGKMKDAWEDVQKKKREAAEKTWNYIRDGFVNMGKKAWEWGSNLIKAFADGMKKQKEKVKNAAKDIGDKIKNVLGISSDAKEGPLSDLTKWGGNLVKTYAKEMALQTPSIDRASSAIAQSTTGMRESAITNNNSTNNYSPTVTQNFYNMNMDDPSNMRKVVDMILRRMRYDAEVG